MRSCTASRILLSFAALRILKSSSNRRARSATQRWQSPTSVPSPVSCGPTWRSKKSLPLEKPTAGRPRWVLADRSVAEPLKLLIGAEFRLECGLRFVVLVIDRRGYGRLCRLITRGRRAATKGEYSLTRADVEECGLEQCFVLWLPGAQPREEEAAGLPRVSRGCVSRSSCFARAPIASASPPWRLSAAGSAYVCVASGDVHMHTRARRRLQDAVTSIRLGVPVAEAGWHLVSQRRALSARARAAREALSGRVARGDRGDRGTSVISHSMSCVTNIPTSWCRQVRRRPAICASSRKRVRCWRWPRGRARERACRHREGAGADRRAVATRLFFSPYMTSSSSRAARTFSARAGGRPRTRSSAYCLGVTAVDPKRGAVLLFERFISKERSEPPDIDIDFEHDRREEVIQHIYEKYSRERAAIAATVIMYRPRSALRDLGKVFGLTPEESGNLAKVMQWWDGGETMPERLREAGFDPDNPTAGAAVATGARAGELPGLSPASIPTRRRVRDLGGAARGARACRERLHGRPYGGAMGQGRSERPGVAEGRCARARHVVGIAAGVRPGEHLSRHAATPSAHCPPKTPRSTR